MAATAAAVHDSLNKAFCEYGIAIAQFGCPTYVGAGVSADTMAPDDHKQAGRQASRRQTAT